MRCLFLVVVHVFALFGVCCGSLCVVSWLIFVVYCLLCVACSCLVVWSLVLSAFVCDVFFALRVVCCLFVLVSCLLLGHVCSL